MKHESPCTALEAGASVHTWVTLQTTPTGDTSASVTAIVVLPTAKYDICSANMQQDPLHTSVAIVTVITICSTAQCRDAAPLCFV